MALPRDLVDSLFPRDLPEPGDVDGSFPARDLPEGALVTRFGPSPTGFLHIGGVYVAMISKEVARTTGGVYFVRIEDTDKVREIDEAWQQFEVAFRYFDIASDEGADDPWGPYTQSARQSYYLTYVRELMRAARAYPCFCKKEDLAKAAEEQREQKEPVNGYRARWALCRNLGEWQVRSRLDAGDPYVVRFRSHGDLSRRVSYVDEIRGPIEQRDNSLDVVLLKTSASQLRLPTYHLAHAVDDHLMRVNMVIRGEEWISSVPLHLQLFDALGFPPPRYAHIAPLLKVEGKSKRKLSKRKDPEASVQFYIDAGYPSGSIRFYLRGLANSRLAEMTFEDAAQSPLRLEDCSKSGPVFDIRKLESISRDYVAALQTDTLIELILSWSAERVPDLFAALTEDPALTERVFTIGFAGQAKARKDIAKWEDFQTSYGFFFSRFWERVPAEDERYGGLAPGLVRDLAATFVSGYREAEEGGDWFEQIREAAQSHGFAVSGSDFKEDPQAYPGSIREAATVIRVALTGAVKSPDLHVISRILGREEVLRRVSALSE